MKNNFFCYNYLLVLKKVLILSLPLESKNFTLDMKQYNSECTQKIIDKLSMNYW